MFIADSFLVRDTNSCPFPFSMLFSSHTSQDVRIAKNRKTNDSSIWCGERETAGRSTNTPLWESLWRFLRTIGVGPASRYSHTSFGFIPSQDEGNFHPLMLGNVTLLYICSWCHESLHVYSLAGHLVPRISRFQVDWTTVLLMGLQPLQLLQSFF